MSKMIRWSVVGVVLLVAVGFSLNKVDMLVRSLWEEREDPHREELAKELQRMRDEGIPVDNASLMQWYQKHTDPTDTAAWQKIFKTVMSTEFLMLGKGVPRFDYNVQSNGRTLDSWPEEEPSRAFLAKTVELRNDIRELASKRVAVRFTDTFEYDDSHVKPEYPLLRITRLVTLQLDAALQDRDSKEILAASQTLLDLSHLLSEEPFYSAHFTSLYNFRSEAVRALCEALERDMLASEELISLTERLQHEPKSMERWGVILRGDIAMAIPAFAEPQKYFKSGTNKTDVLSVPKKATAQDCLNFLRHMSQLSELDKLSLAEASERCVLLDQQLKAAVEASDAKRSSDWLVAGAVTLTGKKLLNLLQLDHQRLCLVLHGVAIRRYQDQLGELPPDLLALKAVDFDTLKNLPVGPKPLGYRREEGKAILWATHPVKGLETTDNPPAPDPNDSEFEQTRDLIWKFQ